VNGPAHYREAERLLDAFKEAHLAAEAMPDATVEQFEKRAMAISTARVLLDKAQVHATLAHAAAVADTAVQQYLGDESRTPREWTEVAG